jgi:ADP-heptose:LPS heptosyltransferase
VNFLITEFTGLGDFLQKTPLIQAIKAQNPLWRVFLIGDNRWGGLDLVKDSELVDDTFDLSRLLSTSQKNGKKIKTLVDQYQTLGRDNKRKICSWLNGTKFDYALQSYADDVPSEINRLLLTSNSGVLVRHVEWEDLKTKSRWGVAKELKCVKKREILVPHLRGHHDIDGNFDLLQAIVDTPIQRQYECFVAKEGNKSVVDRFNLTNTKYVCIQPGAASGLDTPKRWAVEKFIELCIRLYQKGNITPVLIGDQGDLKNTIEKVIWPPYVVNTAGVTSLDELVGLMKGADSVVAHDSGIMHIANALDISLIALYGPTDFSRTRPLGRRSKIIFSKTEHLGIMFASRLSEKKLAEQIPYGDAMAGITVDQVFSALLQIGQG